MIVGRGRLATAIALIALAASVTSIANDFTYDDRVIILENPRVHSIGAAVSAADETYWPSRNGAALYRPLTIGLFATEWTLGRGSPRLFHAVSIALYVAVCVGVLLLLGELVKGTAAHLVPLAIAAALFAVHPVHVEAVANIVGQAELLAALALIGAFLVYLRARRSGELGAKHIAGVVGVYLAACLSKEHAVVFPALLVAAELTVLRGTIDNAIAVRRLRPFALLALAGVLYLVVRATVVGGVSGEIPHLAMRDASFAERAWTMLTVAPEWLRLLFWPARLSADYSPREIQLVRTLTPAGVAGLILIVAACALVAITWRRRPVIAFGISWIAIALFPVSNLLVPTGILLAERTLFLASIGAAIVVAGMLEMAFERWAGRRLELRAVGAVAALVALAGLVHSAARQRIWKNNATFFAQMLKDAPLSYRAHWANGAHLFEAGKPEQGEQEMRIAIALFPRDADLIEDLASRYLRAGLCQPAVPAFRDVLAIDRDRETARMGLSACLLRLGEFRAAALEARAGFRDGRKHPDLERLAFVADSLAGVR